MEPVAANCLHYTQATNAGKLAHASCVNGAHGMFSTEDFFQGNAVICLCFDAKLKHFLFVQNYHEGATNV